MFSIQAFGKIVRAKPSFLLKSSSLSQAETSLGSGATLEITVKTNKICFALMKVKEKEKKKFYYKCVGEKFTFFLTEFTKSYGICSLLRIAVD